MTTIIGRQINIGIGKESTRGTAVAPSHYIRQMSADVDDKFEGVLSEQSIGILEESDEFDVTKRWSEGSIEGRVLDSSFGLILLATMGTVASVESADAGVYDHTFTVNQTTVHPSLTLDIKKSDIEQKKYANCVIDSLEITADPAELVKFNASFMGKKGEASTETPSYGSENGFLGKHVTVKLADTYAGLSGASAINVNNLSLTITKSVASDDILGSIEPDDFYNGRFIVEGQMELLFDATTYKDKALAGDRQSLQIAIANSDVTIGATSNPTITVELPKIKITEYSEARELDEIVRQTVSFKGLYDTSESKMIDIVLKNEDTSI